MAQRLRYIRESIKKLKPLGVEHVGSTNRIDLAKEVSEASVLAYCTDTVMFSEGFSVSTLENLAGFTVPIVSDVDCLGSVYKDSGAVVIKSPVRDNLDEFRNAVIKGLTDKKYADSVIDKCRIFAHKHAWSKIAKKLEQIVNENKNR
jgi:glycosyltransferase involved in cell wall biosynthesis